MRNEKILTASPLPLTRMNRRLAEFIGRLAGLLVVLKLLYACSPPYDEV